MEDDEDGCMSLRALENCVLPMWLHHNLLPAQNFRYTAIT